MLGIPCSAEIRPYVVKTLGHTTARQAAKDEKRRKDTSTGGRALIDRWYDDQNRIQSVRYF